MTQALRKSTHIVLREDSGALSVADNPAAVQVDGHRVAILHLRQVANLATPDGDDVVNFFIDVAYGDGGDGTPHWVNAAFISYVNADDASAPEAVIVIGSEHGANLLTNDLQADLGAEGVRANVPLGDRLRVRTTVAGATAPTYRYEVLASLYGG